MSSGRLQMPGAVFSARWQTSSLGAVYTAFRLRKVARSVLWPRYGPPRRGRRGGSGVSARWQAPRRRSTLHADGGRYRSRARSTAEELPSTMSAPSPAREPGPRLRAARASAAARLQPRRPRPALPRVARARGGGPRPIRVAFVGGRPGSPYLRAHTRGRGAAGRVRGGAAGDARGARPVPAAVLGLGVARRPTSRALRAELTRTRAVAGAGRG